VDTNANVSAGRHLAWPAFAATTRWILACTAFAALAVTDCGGPSGPAEPAHPPRCSRLLFVGVRGSGEDPTQLLAMGTTVYPIFAGLRKADPQLAGYGWAYRGERPDIPQLMRAAGALGRFLRERARRCPAERVILAGYSAGAVVVGDVLQMLPPQALAAERMAAAVLLADPEFNPADMHTAAGTFDPRYGGSPRRRAFPGPLASRIRSYCRRHDIVCQRQDPAASKVEHGNYQPQQTGEAISFIEVTLDFRKAKGAENAR
jgi:predicted esterase